MATIAEALTTIRSTLPRGVELVAVSKFHPAEAIAEAYASGQRTFGESRVQEIVKKIPALPADINWHFIGHLQTNKVRQLLAAAPNALIESVDSERLLTAINAEATRMGIVARVLLQLHVAAEETKFGFSPDEMLEFFKSGAHRKLSAVRLCGVMGMATNTDDEARITADFERIAAMRREIITIAPELVGFDHVSMGMSDDYPLAIAAGSNLIRIGTAIFGARHYS